MMMTTAARADRKAVCSFKNVPIIMVKITATLIKNKLGWWIRNKSELTHSRKAMSGLLHNPYACLIALR